MRILSDRKRVLENLADDYRRKNHQQLAESTAERAKELNHEYQVLREVLDGLCAPEPMAD